MKKKVMVSGCFDLLHSGHVEFFRSASQYGNVYVSIGSDSTIQELKKRPAFNPEHERLYMVKAIRYVKDAFIAKGNGMLDFIEEMKELQPDIFIVNEDGDNILKRKLCEELNIEYIVLKRQSPQGLPTRSTTSIREVIKK
jgi:cytidyltransferase-like protein